MQILNVYHQLFNSGNVLPTRTIIAISKVRLSVSKQFASYSKYENSTFIANKVNFNQSLPSTICIPLNLGKQGTSHHISQLQFWHLLNQHKGDKELL